MQRISYAAGSILTGDAIAHAIVKYAEALAGRSRSDSVAFPVVLVDGTVGTVEILLGPASQMMSVPVPSTHDDVTDDELVSLLTEKADRLGISHPEADNEARDLDYDFDQ